MNLCSCIEDGYCPRYQRAMQGRFREICAGINVDLGTAAAFREQWVREAGAPLTTAGPAVPLLLRSYQAPGDAVAMTAAIYSLHRAHPGRYATTVDSLWPEVFMHNPDVVPPETVPSAVPLQMHYPAIHQCNDRGIHFMEGWCEFLGSALGISVPLLTNRPHLYFGDDEWLPSDKVPAQGFWLVCSGGKHDFTAKLWGHDKYQAVVSSLKGVVRFVQVGADQACHPPLDGAVDMVGRTSLRELFILTRLARGVLCGVSLMMHVAAALGRPAVVLAGGREPVQWNAYPYQSYIHTIGVLPCRDTRGRTGGACWRHRTVPLGDNVTLDRDTCEYPVRTRSELDVSGSVPKCMSMILPSEVANLILRYDSAWS